MRALRLTLILFILPLATAVAQAAPITLAVSATILSKNQCKFSTASAILNFGTLDPSAPAAVSASANLNFVCRGSDAVAVYLLSDDNGLYETSPGVRRMRHATLAGSFIPYGLSYTPTTGTAPRNAARTLTLTGTLSASSYALAPAGNYSDTVVLTIIP